MTQETWTDRVEDGDYPYPRASAAAKQLQQKLIPEEHLAAFEQGDTIPSAQFLKEVPAFFRYLLQEQIEHESSMGVRIRPMLVRDLRVLESALDTLALRHPLNADEIEILAVKSDTLHPENESLRHDIVGEVRAYIQTLQQLKEEAEDEPDFISVLLMLEGDVRNIAVTLGDELSQQQGRSSTSPQ